MPGMAEAILEVGLVHWALQSLETESTKHMGHTTELLNQARYLLPASVFCVSDVINFHFRLYIQLLQAEYIPI